MRMETRANWEGVTAVCVRVYVRAHSCVRACVHECSAIMLLV
jgi:phage tail protein X